MLIAIGMMRGHRLSWLTPLHTPDHERHAREMLARFTIEQHAGAVASTLPQGVRKLLDIAMATVAEPRSCCSTSRPAVWRSRRSSRSCGPSWVRSGSRRRHACSSSTTWRSSRGYAHRVIAFYEGRVLADGPVKDVLANDEVRKYVIGSEIHREKEKA